MTSTFVYVLLQGLEEKVNNLPKAFTPQGSITFANLPAQPTEDKLGYLWNITDNFTTDSRFIEGAGKQHQAGNNVAVIKHNNAYYYDVMSAVDLSNYYTKTEVDTKVTDEKSAREAADLALQNGKLDIMPGDEHTAGNAYNLPYFFKTSADANKVTVTAETVTLDGNKTYGSYSMDVPAATTTKAGLLSAADKAIVDSVDYKIEMEATNRADADALLRSDLGNEVSARTSGDNALNEAINQEAITREQADSTLQTNIDKKQDKLVAGTNIQIAADGKTISATDTVYDDTQVRSLISSKQDTISDLTDIRTNATNGNTALTNMNGLKFVALTQAEYDALATKDASTLYIIKSA